MEEGSEDGEDELRRRIEALSEADCKALARNVANLFAGLPHKSWLKRPLVEKLLHGGLSRDAAEQLSGLKRNTIAKAPGQMKKKRARNDYVDPFLEATSTGLFRKKHVNQGASERAANAEDWLKQQYVASRSGDTKESYRTHYSRWASYNQYSLEGGTAGYPIFQASWGKVGVTKERHSLHDYFSCTVCQAASQRATTFVQEADELGKRAAPLAAGPERQQLEMAALIAQANAAEIQGHVITFQTQRDTYLSMRENIGSGELFITADFGVHQVQVSEGGAGQLPDLVLVLHFLNRGKELVHCFLDCLPLHDQHESKDWNYVASVFDELYACGFFAGFKTIIWWSDTGPAHFRTSNTLYYWRKFQDRTSIIVKVFFFAPYHGHSMCDGHIGAISRAITFAGNKLNGELVHWNRLWVEAHIARLKMTAIVHADIVRPEKVVHTLTGVRKYLVFSFDPAQPNSITCGRMCGELTPEVRFFELLDEAALASEAAREEEEHAHHASVAGLPLTQAAIFE